MNKKLVGIGIAVAIIAIAVLIGMSSNKAPAESSTPSNTQIPNATQKTPVEGRHITVELNESMALSSR